MTTLTLLWDPATSPTRPASATPVALAHAPTEVVTPLPPTPADDGRAAALVAHCAGAGLEVLQRRRHPRQLASLFEPEALTILQAWSSIPAWNGARVGSSRATVLNPRVVEGCVRVECGDRHVMVLLRIEREATGWRCVRLDVLASQGHLDAWGVAA